jgi:very-short-patch-repair endonuclease
VRKSDHNYAAARKQRRTMTLPEGLLWRELRGKRAGLKFKRQHPVGPYVIDFYCPAAKVGFEVDGIAHDMGDRAERDAQRSDWLAKHGIAIVRIAAADVLADPLRVAESIVTRCRQVG